MKEKGEYDNFKMQGARLNKQKFNGARRYDQTSVFKQTTDVMCLVRGG
jgi:hypothetical protein